MPRQGARRRAKQAAAERGVARAPKSRRAEDTEAAAADGAGGPSQEDEHERAVAAAADVEEALGAGGDAAERMFELANKPAVRLSIGGGVVEVVQDRAATEHSGGVVWETAYFLTRYFERHLLRQRRRAGAPTPARVAELGAGCGLLGLALARLGCEVVLTEQPAALANLKANAKRARATSAEGGARPPRAMRLSWGDAAHAAAVRARGPFDFVVASDVVFAERFVGPLLQSIEALLAPEGAAEDAEAAAPECWLCLQQRDPDAHAALLRLAPERFDVEQLSFEGLCGFEAAVELECLLLRLRLRPLPRKKRRRAEAAEEAEAEDVAGADEEAGQSRKPAKKSRRSEGSAAEDTGVKSDAARAC